MGIKKFLLFSLLLAALAGCGDDITDEIGKPCPPGAVKDDLFCTPSFSSFSTWEKPCNTPEDCPKGYACVLPPNGGIKICEDGRRWAAWSSGIVILPPSSYQYPPQRWVACYSDYDCYAVYGYKSYCDWDGICSFY